MMTKPSDLNLLCKVKSWILPIS